MDQSKKKLALYDKDLNNAKKAFKAALCILLILIIIQNTFPRVYAGDAVIIQDPDFPTGTMDAGDSINMRVWIKNTGTSIRSFWVEVCFLKPGGNPDIDDDWYHATPVESASIKPNKKDCVQLSYTLPQYTPPGTYGVAVEVWDGYDASSGSMVEPIYTAEYNWDSFTVTGPPETPIIVYPNGDTLEESTVSFQWESVSGATNYHLEVKDSDGGVFYSQEVGQTTVQSLDGFDYGDYTWHVKAINSIGESPWSNEGDLHVRLVPNTPTPSSPIGNTLSSSIVTFSWGVSSYATSYVLEVQTLDTVVVYSQDVGNTLSASVEGFGNGDYEWRVKALNSVGEGAWSSHSDFYVRLPPTPTIISLETSANTIDLGDTITVVVDVKNEGYQADEMWVAVLFPDMNEESSIISYDSSEFNGVPVLVSKGDKIDSGYMSATTKALYPMINVDNTPWGAGETRRFTVTVRPEDSGSFTVYAKTVAELYDEYSYYPESGTQDHQGEYVLSEVVEIVEPASPPVADSGGPYTGSEGEGVLLDASGSADPDGDITQYEWDLEGDGVFEHNSTESQLSFTWEDDHQGEVTLRVTDSTGLSSTDSCTITVNNIAPLVEAGPNIDTELLEVSFTAQFEDPGADTHTIVWDFNDESQSRGTLTPVHEYADYGLYMVSVTITDDNGGESSDTLKVHITEPKITVIEPEISIDPSPPTSDSGGPYTGSEGAPILLDAGGSTDPDEDIVEYEWDMDGDGLYEHQSNESALVFTWEDDYHGEATLRVTDSTGLSSTDTCTITINNVAPTVYAGPDVETESLIVSFSAQFEDPGADTHTIVWGYGDEAQSNDSLTSVYVYTDFGTYSVTVTVTDDDGGESSDTLEVIITEPMIEDPPEEATTHPPNADPGGPYSSSEGDQIIFDASGSTDPDDDIIGYEWDLTGDGVYEETTTNDSFSYSWSDDYYGTIWLRVTDSQGNQHEASTSIQVSNVAPTVEAGEDIIVTLGEEAQLIGSFTDLGQDTHTVQWDFGDGETGDSVISSHVYNEGGVFTATLTVIDDDAGQSSDTVTVRVLYPTTLELSILTSCVLSSPVNIEGVLMSDGEPIKHGEVIIEHSVTQGETWSEITTTKTSPKGEFDSTWTPDTTGTYLIRARYEGVPSDYISEASTQTTLAVTEGVVDNVFSITSNSVISDLVYDSSNSVLSFTFSGEPETHSHTRIMIAKTIVPDMEGLLIYVDGTEVEYNYTSDETQWIIEFEHSHSTHKVVITLAETVNQPPIAQTETAYEGKPKAPINFDASASYDSDGDIVEYLWYLGDGETLTGIEVKHKYDEKGDYLGTLTVTDNLGATDTMTFMVEVSSSEAEPIPVTVYYEYQTMILSTPQDLLDLSYNRGATELDKLDSQKAAELLSQVPEEEAANYLSQMSSETRNQIFIELSPSKASKIMNHMSPSQGVEILETLEEEIILNIFEEMESEEISTILSESVKQDNLEMFSSSMNKLDETTVAETLLGLDPVSGARVVESMSRNDLNLAAIRVETIVKMKLREKDPQYAQYIKAKLTETMINVDTEALVDIFVEIANLPKTPSTVAALFEMMPYAKVNEVIEAWMDRENYEEMAKVFSYLSVRKLSELYLGTSAGNRVTLYQYLDNDTKASIPQTSLFEITDLLVSNSTVKTGEPVIISAKVSNIGDEPSTYRLKMRIDQSPVAEEMLYIDSGGSETLSWTVRRTTPKTYFVNLGLLKESFIVEKKPAQIVSSLIVSTCVTEPGVPVRIRTSISNKGEAQGNFNAELKIDGEYITTVSETLDGGDIFVSRFRVSRYEEGMHEVSLGDKTCFFLVEKVDESSLMEMLQDALFDMKSFILNRLGILFRSIQM